jgi:hypothetical protein
MTLTFLLTDIEGSTRLWETHRQARGEALACHDRLVLQVVADHGGCLVKAKGEGDSSFSVFTSPAQAVAAALELQRALPPSPGRCRHRWRCGRRCMPGGSGARGRLLRAGGQPVRSAARHRPRLPVAPGRLHPHPGHLEAGQPHAQLHQPRGGRGEPAGLDLAPPWPSGTRTQAVTESLCTSRPAQRSTSVSTLLARGTKRASTSTGWPAHFHPSRVAGHGHGRLISNPGLSVMRTSVSTRSPASVSGEVIRS